MKKYTQKELRELVALGVAIDITNAGDRSAVSGDYVKIGYSSGVYGCNGLLLKSTLSGQLYAVCKRTTAIYIF